MTREADWVALLARHGLSDSTLVNVSLVDPTRRVYRLGHEAIKIAIRVSDECSAERAQTLGGERAILLQCEGIRGVPRVIGYELTDREELLRTNHVDAEPLARARLTPGRLLAVLVRLSLLLVQVSVRGVSHNDVTPENLLVGSNGQVALVDFDQASRTGKVSALYRNLLSPRRGRNGVYGSLLSLARQEIERRMRGIAVHAITQVKRQLAGAGKPRLHPNASARARLLRHAWLVAASSNANSPGRGIAYYWLNVDGVHLPGERPWMARWVQLAAVIECRDRRILELGSNMALLSTFLMREAGAAASLAVDRNETVLRAARIVAAAFDVSIETHCCDFDDSADWESALTQFSPDVVFALSVLNWVSDKDRFMRFLASFEEVVFEGHDSPEIERARLMAHGFRDIRVVGTSDRGRTIFHCRRSERALVHGA